MLDLTNSEAEICVVGRCSFQSGIGSMTYAACEMLARAFPVCILPTESHLRDTDWIELPNKRRLPVCKSTDNIKATFFCDVLWNGAHDHNYELLPEHGLKYAYIVFDSDELPTRWVQILNDRFDLVVVTSPHLLETVERSRVDIPAACLPIALDLEPLLAAPAPARRHGKVRFGSIAAFHPRKGVELLVDAFLDRFAGRTDVELLLHSNLAFGDTLDRVRQKVADRGAANVVISHGSLSESEKNRLVASIDVFCNCSRGEAYSIGPREALAYGRGLLLSDVGGHKDLAGLPGVFMVPPDVRYPARFPEIDNLVFGEQRSVRVPAVARALDEALAFAQSGEYDRTVAVRRGFAQNYSFTRLATPFAELVNPGLGAFRKARSRPADVVIPERFTRTVQARLGPRADRLSAVRRRVTAAYDAGFFSMFNAFISSLVWDLQDGRCHGVVPDWDVDRLIERAGDARIMSFCYGRPGDGNIWSKLFQPLYDLTADEMNDPAFLYHCASAPETRHNEHREPLMTYVHAYRLYRSREFGFWRRQYHAAFKDHVHLIPDLQDEIDRFTAAHFGGKLMIAAHVRHPSHTVEQPDAKIAHTEAYVARIYEVVRRRGLDSSDPGWGVFLATDQERVVERFRAEFGDKVCYFGDVRRTRADEDAAYDALPSDEKNRDGYQLQHLVAASRENWSIRMAREVVRDAWVMARCHVLLHVVSNVSTAVAYMNPDLEMLFCSA